MENYNFFLTGRRVLKELLDNQELVNGTVQTEDGGSFNVHIDFLAATSQYIRRSLTQQEKNEPPYSVLVPGVSKDTMANIINFMYTGKLHVTIGKVSELVRTLEMLRLPDAVGLCEKFLQFNITEDRCIMVYTFAKFHRLADLKEKAKHYILTHFQTIFPTSKDYLDLPADDVLAMLSSDSLNVKSEEYVFWAVMRWVEHAVQERLSHLPSLIRCIRLGLCNFGFYERNIQSHPFLVMNDDCLQILIQTSQLFLDMKNGDPRQPMVDLHHPFLRPRIPYEIIFVMGGWSAGSATNVVETYDVKCGRWFISLTADTSPRAYHGMVWHQGSLYVIGGFDGNQCFNSVMAFNPATRLWREVGCMAEQRCYVSVACLGDYVYAMGGYDGHRRNSSVERYLPETNQWSFVAPMNHVRSDASADTLDGKIYIAGGFNGSQVLDSVEFYDPESNQWTLLPVMSSPRSGVKVASYNDFLFVIGGFNGNNRLSTVEKYDPKRRIWMTVPSMRGPRSNFAAAVVDGCLYAIGGFNECFDHQKNIWTPVTDLNLNRSALACCVVYDIPNAVEYSFIAKAWAFSMARLSLSSLSPTSEPELQTMISSAKIPISQCLANSFSMPVMYRENRTGLNTDP
ncbi:kelch-like protein 10 [Uloborus diversus]|uniref:kelch-like protein 10 n=1 Tax=Uloborus diversus TaxID=327109 RepID=UPI002409AAB1|nr:kelch-like protein 10 [Uloborus diversus]